MLLLMILLLIISAVVLAWSADRFVQASIAMARRWHWPPMVVGVVLVGFGTSFPELVVSLMASLRGKAILAVGNVVGSNIANLTLVLGLALLMFPIVASPRLFRLELPVLLVISLFVGGFLCWFGLGWPTLLCLLGGLCLMLFLALRHPEEAPPSSAVTEVQPFWRQLLWWLLGLFVLFISAECFVHAAVVIARAFGLSELLIGLTVVTLGTSLPEVAATLVSARRGQHDIAIGHLIGSNIFNLCAVLAMPALVSPVVLPNILLRRDYCWMLAITLLLWGTLYVCRRQHSLPKCFGVLLLLVYAAYMLVLIMAT